MEILFSHSLFHALSCVLMFFIIIIILSDSSRHWSLLHFPSLVNVIYPVSFMLFFPFAFSIFFVFIWCVWVFCDAETKRSAEVLRPHHSSCLRSSSNSRMCYKGETILVVLWGIWRMYKKQKQKKHWLAQIQQQVRTSRGLLGYNIQRSESGNLRQSGTLFAFPIPQNGHKFVCRSCTAKFRRHCTKYSLASPHLRL